MIPLLELRRQIFHIISGTTLALLFYTGVITKVHLTMLLTGLTLTFIAYTRVRVPGIHEMLVLMERKKNMKFFPGSGALFFVLGITLAPWIFSKDTATAAILILAWSDGIASLIGPYGKTPYINTKKTWEGIIAAIMFGTIAASSVVPFLYAFPAATVAMLIEGLDIKIKCWKVDDNVIIPVIAGSIISVLRHI